VIQHQRNQVRAQNSQDASEHRPNQFLEADFPDTELEDHDAAAHHRAYRSCHRTVQVERMQEKSRAG
jgi:hypothetical protein